MTQSLFRLLNQLFLILAAYVVLSCAKKEAADPVVTLPAVPQPTVPFTPPPAPYMTQVQINAAGAQLGPTPNAYRTQVSLGDGLATQTGTTTHGYRVKYNVQNPHGPR